MTEKQSIADSELLKLITGAIKEAVSEALESHCPLTVQERKSVPHLYGLFRDMGDGDIDRGIRKFRAVFEFSGSVYNWRNIVSGALILAGVMAVFGWLASLFVSGLAAAIKGL